MQLTSIVSLQIWFQLPFECFFLSICNCSDFPSQASLWPYFWPSIPSVPKPFPGRGSPDDGIHLVVCVHGLDGQFVVVVEVSR